MNRLATILLIISATIFSAGCSMMAPQYTASLDNVQSLKNAGDFTASLGEFTSSKDKENANPISIRGSSLNSPYQDSYAAYLAEAIKQELSLAQKLSQKANIELSGTLTKNDIDAAMGTAHSDIEARFIVKKGGSVSYDQVKSVHHEWESSFVGAIAIPRAIQEYPVMVQKLLAALYADKAFINALK
jgi:hypothetical protein